MATHMRYECKHGKLVSQCRCPSPNKVTRITDCPDSCARRDEDKDDNESSSR